MLSNLAEENPLLGIICHCCATLGLGDSFARGKAFPTGGRIFRVLPRFYKWDSIPSGFYGILSSSLCSLIFFRSGTFGVIMVFGQLTISEDTLCPIHVISSRWD